MLNAESGIRVRAVAGLADAWLAPESRWMRKAAREIPKHTPYSPAMVRACLKRAFTGYHEKALKEWIQQDLLISPSEFRTPRSALPILICSPSTVFAATWQATAAVWLAGYRPVIKPSRREPLFARLLQQSARSLAPKELPLEVLKPSHQNLSSKYPVIIAYGNDVTLKSLPSALGITNPPSPATHFISFGMRISAAVIGKTLARKNMNGTLRDATLDTVLYETQGCLSPQCFFVENGGSLSAESFAKAFSKAIEQLDSKLPQVPLPNETLEEESFWQRWRFRASQGKARIFGRHALLHYEPFFEPCGLKRVVFVVPIRNLRDLKKHLGKWTPRISTLAASDSPTLAKLKKNFKTASGIRFCSIGQMHTPPPSWRNGGVNLLREISHVQRIPP